MPTNVTYAYSNAEQEYHEAETIPAKLKALKKMLATVPKHKGTEKLQSQIKEKIRKLKYKREKEAKQKKGRSSLAIKKEGAAQVAIIGLPNSGKSTLLQKLSGKPVEIAEYEFTTKKPVIRMIPFENIKIQAIEIPALYNGIGENPKARQLFGLIRNADLIIIVLKEESELEIIKKELDKASIRLPAVIIKQSKFVDPGLKELIWSKLNVIRVQTKTSGKIAKKPVILKAGSRVKDIVGRVHKDFLKNFKHAKIWGPSAKFPAQAVGLEHKLKDKDIVEIFTK